MAKPSNIFYVLRICETTTLRHLACSSPLEIPLFSAQTSNKPEPYIYGWEYIKNTLTKISSQWQREKEGKKKVEERLRTRNHVTGLQGHTGHPLWGNQNRSKCHL